MASRRELTVLVGCLVLGALGALGWRALSPADAPQPAGAVPVQASAEARRIVSQAEQLYREGDHLGAVEAVRRALEQFPHDPAALAFAGLIVRDAQGVAAALPYFEQAAAAAPDDLGVLGEYAATLGEAGRNAEMLSVARRMVEIDPRDPRAYFLQAALAARAGHDDLARRLLWKTGGAYAEVPAAMLLSGAIDLRSGNAGQAVRTFDALARLRPENPVARVLRARALLAQGNAFEAAATLRPLADRSDASPYVLALAGRALEQLGDRDAAAAYLDRSMRPLPRGAAVLPASAAGEPARWRSSEGAQATAEIARVRNLLLAGDAAAARTAAELLAARFPGSADVARVTGDARLLAGDPAAALAAYHRAAAVRRDFPLVERMTAAFDALGRPEEADAMLEEHLAGNPRDFAAARLLGQRAVAAGDWGRGALLLEHAAALGAGDDPRLLADLARARLALGDAPGALRAAGKAQALQRGNGWVAEVLAAAMEAGGERPREAEVLLAKARQLALPPVLARR